ncbi:MAG: Ribosomal protein [Cyanobacteriota bacterium]|jgi:large subunit ribosomal protein L35
MPKQKTNKSAKKRFKLSAGGKLMFKKGGIKHLNAHMSARHKRRLRKPEGEVSAAHKPRIMTLFPYIKYV